MSFVALDPTPATYHIPHIDIVPLSPHTQYSTHRHRSQALRSQQQDSSVNTAHDEDDMGNDKTHLDNLNLRSLGTELEELPLSALSSLSELFTGGISGARAWHQPLPKSKKSGSRKTEDGDMELFCVL